MTTILLVDDSETDRRLFGGMLSKEPDFEVTYAEHGAAGCNTSTRLSPIWC